MVVVILAHDEAEILRETLPAIIESVGQEDVVYVVADNCLDKTAQVSSEMGAHVLKRTDKRRLGKGPALHWWLEQMRDELGSDCGIVVLDADSRLSSGFIDGVKARLARGVEVFQTRVQPLLETDHGIARLAALSESLEQSVDDRLRSWLGWPVRLRGTGMIIQSDVLRAVSNRLKTMVEDVELTILLLSRGVRIDYASEIWVADPKPSDEGGAIRQRARWLKGQRQIWRYYWRDIAKMVTTGPSNWSVLASMLFKPKSLMIVLKVAGFLGAWAVSHTGGGICWRLLAWGGVISLTLDLVYFTVGTWFINKNWRATLYLLMAPLYLLMWFKSLALSLIPGSGWLKSRQRRLETLEMLQSRYELHRTLTGSKTKEA